MLSAAILMPGTDCRAHDDPREGRSVSTITVTGCRINPEIILKKIPLKAGQPWSEKLEAESVDELNRTGNFKKVSISSRYDAAANAVVTEINARDGWFLLPLPLISGGSNGSGMSLMLISGNLFRQGENIMLGGGKINGASSGMLGYRRDDWFFNARGGDANQTETVYADGAYSLDRNKAPSGAAPVANSYTRKSAMASLAVGRKLNKYNSVGLSFSQAQYDFSGGNAPPEEHGAHNALGLSYECHHDTRRGASVQPAGFGVIFGMGLSGLDEMLKPLPDTARTDSFSVKLAQAGGFVGSDYKYTLVHVRAGEIWEFPGRDKLTLSLQGLKGWNLPLTQLISNTNNQLLYGTYNRDWRGDKALAATAGYTYHLRRTKRGMLIAEPFAEFANIWNGASRQTQSGAGLSFRYRFWRFPMPIGLTFTRSFHDNDWGISAMAGFGR